MVIGSPGRRRGRAPCRTGRPRTGRPVQATCRRSTSARSGAVRDRSQTTTAAGSSSRHAGAATAENERSQAPVASADASATTSPAHRAKPDAGVGRQTDEVTRGLLRAVGEVAAKASVDRDGDRDAGEGCGSDRGGDQTGGVPRHDDELRARERPAASHGTAPSRVGARTAAADQATAPTASRSTSTRAAGSADDPRPRRAHPDRRAELGRPRARVVLQPAPHRGARADAQQRRQERDPQHRPHEHELAPGLGRQGGVDREERTARGGPSGSGAGHPVS